MTRFAFAPALAAVLLGIATGCKDFGKKQPTEPEAVVARPGNWARLGPVGLSVESARVGKVRLGGMMGQTGESREDVFQVKTRFKLFDPAVVVTQDPLQSDGMLGGFGSPPITLNSAADGTLHKIIRGGGFDKVKGRRSKKAELTADNPETTDLLTFEATAGQADELLLVVRGDWQERQPDGTFRRPPNPGSFRIRIPKGLASGPPPAVEAGEGNWYRIGPVAVMVTAVKFGKVTIKPGIGFVREAKSEEDVLSVAVTVRLSDPKAVVKKSPFVPDGGWALSGPSVVLKDDRGGVFPAVVGSGFDRVTGRQSGDVELTAKSPEVRDLLTFDAKAAAADNLVLSLWPNWQEKQPDGTWAEPETDDEFRFRLTKSMWAK